MIVCVRQFAYMRAEANWVDFWLRFRCFGHKYRSFVFDTKALKSWKWPFSEYFQRGRKPFFSQKDTFWLLLYYPTGEVGNIGLEPNWPRFVIESAFAEWLLDCRKRLTCPAGQSCLVWARARVDNNKGLPLLLSWFCRPFLVNQKSWKLNLKNWVCVKRKHTRDLLVLRVFV